MLNRNNGSRMVRDPLTGDWVQRDAAWIKRRDLGALILTLIVFAVIGAALVYGAANQTERAPVGPEVAEMTFGTSAPEVPAP